MDSLWPPGGLQKPSLKNSALIDYSWGAFPKDNYGRKFRRYQ